jgi:ankyrin repeat protein
MKLFLAGHDIDVDSQDDTGRMPLSSALKDPFQDCDRAGCRMVVKMFLARTDVNVNSKDKDGRTPLSFAAERGNAPAVKLLIAHDDVDADLQDEAGRTPLLYALKRWGELVTSTFLHGRLQHLSSQATKEVKG